MTKFSNGVKLFNTVKYKADWKDLQKDFTVSEERAMKWQMKLNVGKCKVTYAMQN